MYIDKLIHEEMSKNEELANVLQYGHAYEAYRLKVFESGMITFEGEPNYCMTCVHSSTMPWEKSCDKYDDKPDNILNECAECPFFKDFRG